MRFARISCMFSLMLYVNICPVLAKAPTTSKILFTSARDGNYEVYVMNPDGSEQMNLTQHRAQDLEAIWSPTGEKILFISDRGGMRDLYLMNTDGTYVRRVFKRKTKIKRGSPTWAPDGKQIAYESKNWDKLEFILYIATFGKQESEELAVGSSSPAWAPDGKQIACIVGGRVTFIDIHTRQQEQLLPKKAMFWQNHPSWSAAGDKLVFSWNNNPLPPNHKLAIEPVPRAWVKKETIYIINLDGTGLQQLVDEMGPEAQYPVLSPNGEEVLYTQKTNDTSHIFKLDVNSGTRTQLTHIGFQGFGNFGGDWFDPAYALPVSLQPHLLTTTWGEMKKR